MALLHVAVRCLAAYGVLLLLLRASGKRTLAQGSPFDFVLALVLGDMVDDLLWAEISLAEFAVAAATLVMMQTLLALVQSRSDRFHAWIDGRPRVLVTAGRVDVDALRAEHIHVDDLGAHLRLAGIEREKWPVIDVARLENNGRVSALKRPEAQEIERRDLERKRKG